MKTQDGATVYDLAPSRQGYSISALFQYSTSGPNGPFQNSVVQPPIVSQNGATFVFVTAEDGADSDNNDSYLTIFYQPV